MKVNNFNKQLAESQSPETIFLWDKIYHQWKPKCRVERNDEYNAKQLDGIDVSIHLPTRRILRIDEKVREKVYNDILLEDFSNIEGEIKGWMWKILNIHFVAYLFKPIKTAYFLPWKELQSLFFEKRDFWLTQYPYKRAKNYIDGKFVYTTLSFPIPISVLLKEIPTIEIVKLRS